MIYKYIVYILYNYYMNFENNVGLINFGNTCFMNASIQLLICGKALGSFLLLYDTQLQPYFQNIDIQNYDIYKYIQTWKDYISITTNNLGPRIMYNRYKILNTEYLGHSQEDSHEFLIYTLNDILEQIKKSINDSILNEEQQTNIMNEIMKIYSINLSQKVYYKNTNITSETFKYENILSLPITDNINSLTEAFNSYLFQDDNESEHSITFKIIEHPKYIFVSLNRFNIDYNNNSFQKNNKRIDMDFETDIFGKKYRLKGFIKHDGGIYGGHYYTYARRKIEDEIKWFCYNDLNISQVNFDTIVNESKLAYVYLYSLS